LDAYYKGWACNARGKGNAKISQAVKILQKIFSVSQRHFRYLKSEIPIIGVARHP
jgi:hypothetical protein